MIAILVLAALVPAPPQPAAPGPTPAFVSLFEAPLREPPRATPPQRAVTGAVQMLGGSATGVGGACVGTISALLPAYLFSLADSGDVGGGLVLIGAGLGYGVGTGWAISAAGREVGGCRGSWLMSALGTTAGLTLTAAVVRTGMVETSDPLIAGALLAPPLFGIAAFEMTRSGPCVRKDVRGTAVILGGVVGFTAGVVAIERSQIEPGGARLLLPLLRVRW